jgi:hypothetical protein
MCSYEGADDFDKMGHYTNMGTDNEDDGADDIVESSL